jgi:hypothetical protein
MTKHQPKYRKFDLTPFRLYFTRAPRNDSTVLEYLSSLVGSM